MVAVGEQHAIVFQRRADALLGSHEVRHLEIPAVAHGHSAAQQVEARADELRGKEVRGRHHALQIGIHRTVDADSAARGVHSRRLLVLGTDGLTFPTFEVLGNLGLHGAVLNGGLQCIDVLLQRELAHLGGIPRRPLGQRSGEHPQLAVVVHLVVHGVRLDGCEVGEAQRIFLYQSHQRCTQRPLTLHIEHGYARRVGDDLVPLEIFNVTLSIHIKTF